MSASTTPIVTAVNQHPQPLESCLSLPRFSSTSARLPCPATAGPPTCPLFLARAIRQFGSSRIRDERESNPIKAISFCLVCAPVEITTRQKLAAKIAKSNVARIVPCLLFSRPRNEVSCKATQSGHSVHFGENQCRSLFVFRLPNRASQSSLCFCAHIRFALAQHRQHYS